MRLFPNQRSFEALYWECIAVDGPGEKRCGCEEVVTEEIAAGKKVGG